jgi:crotonobetainyl-CoA:carnitine CoA-transferase CaiB-like acyl-CoA transferase
VAAPFAASRLADAGARVIKVERPGGDFARGYDSVANGQSAYFVWLNRGKESIVLDLKAPEDSALLRRMIARADVFIQNLAPGAATRAGFGSDELRAAHPRLITCDISGYGEEGPYRDMKAYDLLIQAETGLASVTGGPEAPGRVGVSLCDIAAGMYAVIGILEALRERDRTGQGKAVRVSLFDGMADWMSVPLLQQEGTGRPPARVGLNHPSIAPYGLYRTGDGKEIVIAIQNEREWTSLCATVLERPGLATDPRFETNAARVANRPALDAEIESVFAALSRDDVVRRLTEGRIAFGNVNTPADLAAHPQLRRTAVGTPGGALDMVASPIRFGGERDALGPVPALDQHGAALRREFGPATGDDDTSEGET